MDRLSRRHVLRASLLAAVGLSGCISETDGSQTTPSPTPTQVNSTPPGTTTENETPTASSVTVSDFILYPLAGTHPHVHRRANTQYLVVRLNESVPQETPRHRLALELDGESVPLADRQPVPWRHDTRDVAFAIPKDETFESGRVLYERSALLALSNSTLDRLNTPPVFDVSSPSISPPEIQAGDQIEATVTFRVTNTGAGGGEFGASLKGNLVSGANTLTATLEAGADRVMTGTTRLAGNGETATVRLDWGADEWTSDLPVVGTPSESEDLTESAGRS